VSGGVDVVAVGDADAALSDPFDPARLAGGKYTSACVSECVMESGTRRAERSGSHGPPGRLVIDAWFSALSLSLSRSLSFSRFMVFLNSSHRVRPSLLSCLMHVSALATGFCDVTRATRCARAEDTCSTKIKARDRMLRTVNTFLYLRRPLRSYNYPSRVPLREIKLRLHIAVV